LKVRPTPGDNQSVQRQRSALRCVGLWLAACGVLIATTACDSATGPSSDNEDLRLTVTVVPSTVAPGQIATITFTLENTGDETVNLTFNTGCQVLPYIRVRTTNVIIYPTGGDWSCTAVITQLSLHPGGSVQRVVRVRAPSTPGDAEVILPPGEYQTFARLDDIRVRIQAEPVAFVVQ
jgi:Intracellular proteinase inhibitor